MEKAPLPVPETSPSSSASTPHPHSQWKAIILLVASVCIVSIALAGAYWMGKNSAIEVGNSPLAIEVTPNPSMEEGVACTMDAKICPDGSAVGRVGPNCEFAPCPSEESGDTNPERLDVNSFEMY